MLADEGLELALFRATYPGLDPGTLSWSVFDGMLGAIGSVRTFGQPEYAEHNEKRVALARTNRRLVIEGYYPALFRKVSFD